MAVITRIEVVNYLCEGWRPSMGIARWRPLWPANTIRLAGQSAAIQIPNGCGKTSVTNAVLYLLSRDRSLKREFLSRCAPLETGFTHVRVEFAIRTHEDVTQRDLITLDPLECPAQTYVLGVCANRGDEDVRFYRYPGMLEDAPAYGLEGSAFVFTPNDKFRSRVKGLPKAEWDRWGSIAEWGKVVGEFMSPEVVRQNVIFHRNGAGDASATFNKITVEPGERFDEAYFRQVAAPQLLANAMGDSAEEDERSIEDTITISMTRFIDAKLKVERKEAHLKQRAAMEAEFAPVLRAADAIQEAESSYQRQLQQLAKDAALIERFAGTAGSALPGVPLDPVRAKTEPSLRDCFHGMALDKDGTVLIGDDALARLLGLNTSHLNQLASRQSGTRDAVRQHAASSQVIDFTCDIKISEDYGGRRKGIRFYDRAAALELAQRRAVDEPMQVLVEAFKVAEQLLDTNPFRREARRLNARLTEIGTEITTQQKAAADAEQRQRALETQMTQRAENQIAYQEFCKHAHLVPEEIRDQPNAAEGWLETEQFNRQEAVSSHNRRVGELSAGWQALLQLRERLGLQTPVDRLTELQGQKEELALEVERTQSNHATALGRRDEQTQRQQEDQTALTRIEHELEGLRDLLQHDAEFRRLFGDVDPLTVLPPIDELASLRLEIRQQTSLREPKGAQQARLQDLGVAHDAFAAMFGDVDPHEARPQADLQKLNEEQHAAELIYSEHQPLAEALEQHRDMHGVEPSEWMQRTDSERRRAERAARDAEQAIEDLERELAALDDLSLVDDVDFAAAHVALTDGAVFFERLRDVILASTPIQERRLSLLSAFGAVLSAPVVADLAAAESAMQALRDLGFEIPILLREPLLQALGGDSIFETASGAAAAFIAGSRTRRVRAILEPQALEEEKRELGKQLELQRALHERAFNTIQASDPHTDVYRLALRAQEALRQGSPAKANEADQTLHELAPRIERAQRLAGDDAIRALTGAREFVRLGGKAKLDALTSEIANLTADIDAKDRRAGELEPLVTRDAVVAHDGAARLARAGGRVRITELEDEAAHLSVRLAAGQSLLDTIEESLRIAVGAAEVVARQVQGFTPAYERETTELRDAIAFEEGGYATFMQDRDRTAHALEGSRDALKPLARVDFTRAQSFKDHGDTDETELQKQIGEAGQAREQAAGAARQLALEEQRLDGLHSTALRTADALHELAHFLVHKRTTIAPYLKDLEEREAGPSPAEAHAAYGRADALRQRLTAWRSADGPFDIAQVTALRAEVEEIDVAKSGADARDAKKRANRARDTFRTLREAFCTDARSSQSAALSQAEIEAIEAATTIEQLRALVQLGERLRRDLEQEQADLKQLQESAETVEAESIETLTRLVESCQTNLTTMNAVMARNPNARFFLEATIISGDDIRKLMTELRDGIEARKRLAESKTSLGRRDNDDASIRAEVRRALIDRIYIDPSVQFRHVGMWGAATQPIQESLSEGQKAALQMMWLIKESEYHLECAIRRHLGGGSKKKLRNRAQRIMFFDGLFSNLTDRALIDEAFKGLGDTGANLQLIGLIHNPEYRNNPQIFPAHVIGRRAGWRDVEGERSFVRFDDGRPDGSIGLATFIVKPPVGKPNGAADG